MLRRADERGFTLVELAVAMSLLLLVTGALLAALDSGTIAERRASTRIDDEQSVQLVLAQLARDVRNAAPPSGIPGPPEPPLVSACSGGQPLLSCTFPDEIDLVYANGAAVVWTYNTTTGVLARQVNGSAGVSVGGLTSTSGTVFRVLGADGANLFSDPSATAADIKTCAVTVRVSVTSSGHAPSKPFVETVDAPLDAPAIDRRGCP